MLSLRQIRHQVEKRAIIGARGAGGQRGRAQLRAVRLDSAMKLRLASLVGCLVGPAIGCVAPGSSIGHVALRGSVQTAAGQGLSDREVQFILPAAYGLGGLDLVLNEPEDFGHRDQSFTVTTDANGEFSYDLGDHIYHVGCWLLPPIGCFPKAPPPPFVLVRVPSFPGEYYAVQTHDGEFGVFGSAGRKPPLAEARLAELVAESESTSADGRRSTVGVIKLRFRGQ
jgi:hypothetical protein